MAGSYDLFDGQQLTGPSEYDSRYGTAIDTLQLHHATMTSLSGLIGMMMPGGREVSANGAMGNDGTLIEVVPLSDRAFTSASSYDRRCLTVECCNTTLAPDWGISDATHRRAGKLAADMFKAGLLGAIDRNYIIGHNEVPGTYATACPGPSFNLDLVVQYALEYFRGDVVKEVIKLPKGKNMPILLINQDNNGNLTGGAHLVGETGRLKFMRTDDQEFASLKHFMEPLGLVATTYVFVIQQAAESFEKVAAQGAPLSDAEIKELQESLAAGLKVEANLSAKDKAELLAAINKPRTGTIS